MKLRFIHEHLREFSLRVMCRVLGVSPSGYYAWRSRPESTRSREDRRLKAKIRAFHAKSRGTYGSVRIHADLREDGESCGRHRVARLMREDGLVGAKAKQFRTTTDSKHSDPVAPNLLNQEFSVETPDRVWSRHASVPRAFLTDSPPQTTHPARRRAPRATMMLTCAFLDARFRPPESRASQRPPAVVGSPAECHACAPPWVVSSGQLAG
jgi:hypothetical protein